VKIFLSGKHEIFPGKVGARYHPPDKKNFKISLLNSRDFPGIYG